MTAIRPKTKVPQVEALMAFFSSAHCKSLRSNVVFWGGWGLEPELRPQCRVRLRQQKAMIWAEQFKHAVGLVMCNTFVVGGFLRTWFIPAGLIPFWYWSRRSWESGHAGPQPRTFRAQWAPLDLNLGPSELSEHRWTSTWDPLSSVSTAGPQPGTLRAQWAPLDFNGQIECQKICQIERQIECQKECQKICQIKRQNVCQIECQKICQIECQKICQIECQKVCQIECQIECQKVCQIKCQNVCQKICQKICQIECQKICQKICQIECQKICQNILQKICQVECQTIWDRMPEDMPDKMPEDMSDSARRFASNKTYRCHGGDNSKFFFPEGLCSWLKQRKLTPWPGEVSDETSLCSSITRRSLLFSYSPPARWGLLDFIRAVLG